MVDAIFDANSLFARSYFAAQASPELRDCETRSGVSVGATVAALKTVLSLLNPHSRLCLPDKVDRMLFCWDSPDSKSDKNRKEKPADYYDQRARLEKTLYRLFGAAQCTAEGEADDAVSTAAYRSERKGNRVYVVSGDKDLQQLLGGDIRIYSLNSKALVRREDMLQRWNLKRPIQLALYLAVAGDPGDGIPGVRGYGPKITERLFEHVQPHMGFAEAYTALRDNLPVKHRRAFDECLEVTLLRDDVPGVPSPAPIHFADTDYVSERPELSTVFGEYLSVYGHYTGRGTEIEDYLD